MRRARGVVPLKHDSVVKNPAAVGTLVFAALRPDLDPAGAQAWLERLDVLVKGVREATGPDGKRTGTVAVGFSPSFFARFPGVKAPAGFERLPPVPGSALVAADVVCYLMATHEAVTATFLRGLSATHPDVAELRTERGYQPPDRTEPFGYRDGVRNVARIDRASVVFVDTDELPEEPPWAHAGTYLAWMKIPQDLDAFAAIPAAEQDQIVGRDRAGRRLDLPEASRSEPPIDGPVPAPGSHVRKAGPRGETRDRTQIFRRGLPFAETSAGRFRTGLQFVSFQASLDQLRVVLNRWMLNNDFPAAGSGQDQLFNRGLAVIESHGFFFVPPDTDEAIGTGIFAPAKDRRPPKSGKVAVRKRVVDTAGTEIDVDLGGFTFQIVDPATGQPVGEAFATNSHGHALSPELPTGQQFRLDEVGVAAPFTAATPVPFTLDAARILLRVDNTVTPGSTYQP